MNRIIISYKMLLSKKVKKQHVFKWRSSNYYRVATLFNLYLTVKGIIMQRLKLIGQLTIRANRYVRTDGRSDKP